ncbi:SDR family NAD(P)-dependent oxidoreductase [Demequina capsici]|uniref:SDR family NAD(P)-dependent oxidoreductase n=1 Tax=Demequina capsici TaxID=3075620 RepID=A0AA96FFZ4_9MICO|nr:SDR family NAD(P)-dependent oxidoreductase [Demequina sp. PMTSA13]WNM28774.1 SDR family NAD(P)-dependent oxidoreductase [Demequina sp. PMTSA13]
MAPSPTAPRATEVFDQALRMLPRLDGRTVAVTGSTSGTGQVMASTCGALGARVLMLNRPSARADAALDALRRAGAEAELIPCDLQSFASVAEAGAALIAAAPDGLDVLCNNAGVMGLPDTATGDGFDIQMQTNHLSHFLLTSLVWPALVTAAAARGDARVVNQSSGARRGPALKDEFLQRRGGALGGDGFPGLGKWRRYQQSKLANLLFTYALHDRMPRAHADLGVKALCAHPGPTDSGLQEKTAQAGGARLLDRMILGRTLRRAHSVEDGAVGILTAALRPSATSGQFYGPEGRGLPGPTVLLAAERDPEAEARLWSLSLDSTGVADYFGS